MDFVVIRDKTVFVVVDFSGFRWNECVAVRSSNNGRHKAMAGIGNCQC